MLEKEKYIETGENPDVMSNDEAKELFKDDFFGRDSYVNLLSIDIPEPPAIKFSRRTLERAHERNQFLFYFPQEYRAVNDRIGSELTLAAILQRYQQHSQTPNWTNELFHHISDITVKNPKPAQPDYLLADEKMNGDWCLVDYKPLTFGVDQSYENDKPILKYRLKKGQDGRPKEIHNGYFNQNNAILPRIQNIYNENAGFLTYLRNSTCLPFHYYCAQLEQRQLQEQYSSDLDDYYTDKRNLTLPDQLNKSILNRYFRANAAETVMIMIALDKYFDGNMNDNFLHDRRVNTSTIAYEDETDPDGQVVSISYLDRQRIGIESQPLFWHEVEDASLLVVKDSIFD